jgi:5-methylcytosine-specific restriction endonuclease McrA
MPDVQPLPKAPFQFRKPAGRIKAQSAKRRKANASHVAIRQQVFERDRFLCRLQGATGAGECFGPLTPHHVRKASQGGAYSVDNLASLCAHHNVQLEADADLSRLAEQMGLVARRNA